MTDPSNRTFNADFKRFFVKGLVVLLPTVLTLWIVVKAYQFVDNSFAEPINRGVRLTLHRATPYWKPLQGMFEPSDELLKEDLSVEFLDIVPTAELNSARSRLRGENIQTWWDEHWLMDFIGLMMAIIGVYVTGRLLGGFFGRQIYRRLERFITTLPVFKQVYPHVKQVVDFLFSDEKPLSFNRVVVVEYPRKGIWSVGFQTGSSMKSVAEDAGDSVTIFIPSSPTPFTGYTITVPRDQVRELPITVEEAIRFAVSGGVLIPQHQVIESSPDSTGEIGSLATKANGGNNDTQSELVDDEASDSDPHRRNAS
ncbi:MAG: DUF502 domain-containing protein [Planctomycetota bacterium]|nr:DUF502 domain-containing protein [Planctomycetota bacterium]